METICSPVRSKSTQESHVLHEVVELLIASFSVKAASNKNFFVNEIPGHLQLSADPQRIAYVVSGLLSAVVSYAQDSCIRLSAKIYGNVILIQVKDSSSGNLNAIESQIRKLEPVAESMRGSVGVTSQRKNITTLTFGFLNLS